MKILHIIKKANDNYAWQTAERQSKREGSRVQILLIQDAVFSLFQANIKVFACQEDVSARGAEINVSLASYQEIIAMLLDADSVVCW